MDIYKLINEYDILINAYLCCSLCRSKKTVLYHRTKEKQNEIYETLKNTYTKVIELDKKIN